MTFAVNYNPKVDSREYKSTSIVNKDRESDDNLEIKSALFNIITAFCSFFKIQLHIACIYVIYIILIIIFVSLFFIES